MPADALLAARLGVVTGRLGPALRMSMRHGDILDRMMREVLERRFATYDFDAASLNIPGSEAPGADLRGRLTSAAAGTVTKKIARSVAASASLIASR